MYLSAGILGAIAGLSFNLFDNLLINIFSPLFLLGSFAFLGKILNSIKSKAMHAYIFGIFYNVVSLYWIGHAFAYTTMPYLKPFASLGIAIPLALHFPISVLISKILNGKFNILTWIVGFSLIELLRTQYSITFPWNPPGYPLIWFFTSIKYWGILGLTLYTLLLSQFFFLSKILKFIVLGLGLLLIIEGKLLPIPQVEYFDQYIRIVQPCLEYGKKWDYDTYKDQLETNINLTNKPYENKLSAIIWPEVPEHNLDYFFKFVPKDTILILGHPRIENNKKFVSMSAIDSNGKVFATYDKRMLVPFGEYVPFNLEKYFPKYSDKLLDYLPGDFTFGIEKPFEIVNFPKPIPSICFDTIYTKIFKVKGDWFVQVTNDMWYGKSFGPLQHLNWARVRAMEYNKPFIRVANSGVSAIISGTGEIIDYIPHNKCDFLDHKLPKPGIPTIFSKFGNITFGIFIAFLLFFHYISSFFAAPKTRILRKKF